MGLVGIPSSTFTHLHHLHLIIFGKCIGEGISTIEIPSPVPKRYTSEGKHWAWLKMVIRCNFCVVEALEYYCSYAKFELCYLPRTQNSRKAGDPLYFKISTLKQKIPERCLGCVSSNFHDYLQHINIMEIKYTN